MAASSGFNPMPPTSALSLSQSLLIPILYRDDEAKQAELLREAARNLAYNTYTETHPDDLFDTLVNYITGLLGVEVDDLCLRDSAVLESLVEMFCVMRRSPREDLRLIAPSFLAKLPVRSMEGMKREHDSLLQFLDQEEPEAADAIRRSNAGRAVVGLPRTRREPPAMSSSETELFPEDGQMPPTSSAAGGTEDPDADASHRSSFSMAASTAESFNPPPPCVSIPGSSQSIDGNTQKKTSNGKAKKKKKKKKKLTRTSSTISNSSVATPSSTISNSSVATPSSTMSTSSVATPSTLRQASTAPSHTGPRKFAGGFVGIESCSDSD